MATFPEASPLTSLRFFAAAAVMLHHSAGFFPGYGGVSFFFVLSGFVLAERRCSMNVGGIPRFLLCRAARIFPLHLLTLAAAMPLSGNEGFLMNVLLLQAWSSDADIYFGYNAPAWSLSVELAFYLAFPVLIGRVNLRIVGVWTIVMVGIALLCLGLDDATTRALFYVNPVARMVEFAAGVALATTSKRAVVSRGFALILVAITISVVWIIGKLTPLTAGLAFLPASMAIISAYATTKSGDQSILTHGIAIKLGQMSFALYLIGQLLQRYAHAIYTENLLANAVAAMAAFPVAYAAHRWIEQPIVARARAVSFTRMNQLA